ncbi:MAG: flavin reductase family protein [Saprospiraceae bacterium]
MKTYTLDDILQLEKYYRISLINKISGLKSANLIGTKNSSGQSNLAIFNSVVHIGANPPYLGFICRPLAVERHTYENIKETGYYTINQVPESIHQKAHQTSAKYAREVSEFDACQLTESYLHDFPVPFVGESPIKIGLSFQEEQLIKVNNTVLVIGKIEQVILPDGLIQDDGNINFEEIEGIAINGLDSYYSCKRIGQYSYARPDNQLDV